jgi:monoamine oxidase
MQYGWTSTVYEANTRIGGRMYSNSDYFSDNRVVEWGGELISTEHTALRNLAHQLNLKLEDVNKLSVGDQETYLIDGQLYSEANLMDEWVGGLYETFKRAQLDAPWQPLYNTVHTPEHTSFDRINAIQFLEDIGYPSSHWVHKLLLTDLVAEYGLLEENSALNLIYLLGWNTHNSGGLPLAGTDERLHVVGGNDLIPHGMANELPVGTIQTGRKLEAIVGDRNGPYTLVFDIGLDETCDKLVLAIPYGLIKNLDIDIRIINQFLPEKNQAIAQILQADNGKVQMEFSDRHWDRVHTIDGEVINQAARAYSNPDGFISTWEGEPGNPSPLGVLVNYNGGIEGKTLSNASGGNVFFGVAKPKDVNRVLPQIEQVWPGISAKYTGKALVSNWWDNPFSKGAFVSPAVNTMTVWWGAQWETEGNMYFAGEACDEEVWSYMDGAIRSGERVAQEIVQS